MKANLMNDNHNLVRNLLLGFLVMVCQTIAAEQFKPCVSIITSVWNGDEFIKQFLIDITRQTIFDQCELIIINANSPGHEETIIQEYAQKYPNIVYKKLSRDPGLYGVWNLAIKMARADLLVNANIDDRMAPNFLQVHVQELKRYPEIDLVYADSYWTDKPNETFEENSGKHRFHPLGRPTPEFSRSIAALLPGCHPMWRKALHEKAGFFDETLKILGDLDMWWRAVKEGSIFKKINGVFGLYYSNPKGLSTSGFELVGNNHVPLQKMPAEIRERHEKIYKEFNIIINRHQEFYLPLQQALSVNT